MSILELCRNGCKPYVFLFLFSDLQTELLALLHVLCDFIQFLGQNFTDRWMSRVDKDGKLI